MRMDCARAEGGRGLLDAVYEAEERAWLRARAAELGWILLEASPEDWLAA